VKAWRNESQRKFSKGAVVMADVGKLALIVSASVDQLQSGLNQAGRMVHDFSTSAISALEKIPLIGGSPIVGGLAGFAGIGAFAETIREGMSEISGLGKLSAQTGIGLDSISGVLFAAKGNSEGLATGMFHLAAEIAKVKLGSKEAADHLERFGLNAQGLAGAMPLDQLKAIAKQFSAMTDPSLRIAMVRELFGRGGTELIPLLAQGEGGINEAIKNGLKIDPADVKTAKEYATAVREIEESYKGLRIAAAHTFGQSVSQGFKALADILKGNGGQAGTHALNALMSLFPGAPNLSSSAAGGHEGGPAGQAVTELDQAAQKLIDTLSQQAETYGMTSRAVDVWKLSMQGATQAQVEQAAELANYLDALDEDQKKAEKLAAFEKENGSPLERFKSALSDIDELGANPAASDAARLKAFQGLRSSLGLGAGASSPGVYEAGSAATEQLLAANIRSAGGRDPTQEIIDAIQQQTQLQNQQLIEMRNLVAALAKAPVIGVSDATGALGGG
jgi:hypothetical protein